MDIRFAKMHGLGNDFMVIDVTRRRLRLSAALIRRWADRRVGVGFDQLLVVEAAQQAGFDFHYRIYNADGGEVEQCGNGARCFALFVRRQGLSDKPVIKVSSRGGALTLRLREDGQVAVGMGRARFEPKVLPFLVERQQARYVLEVAGQALEVGAVSVGNPHIVTLVEDVEQAAVGRLGALLESHQLFPRRVNVGFMQRLNSSHIRLRVYERGVGETRACGSAACAAVAVGQHWGILDAAVTVALPGGMLQVECAAGDAGMTLIGPAAHVFDGVIEGDGALEYDESG